MIEVLASMLALWVIFMVVACCLGTLGQNIRHHWHRLNQEKW